MTERELDHGDRPITLGEVRESIRLRPFRVRVRLRGRRSGPVLWSPEYEPPDVPVGPLLPDLDEWVGR